MGRMGTHYELLQKAALEAVVPSSEGVESSFFAQPRQDHDPRLFGSGEKILPEIRSGVLKLLYDFWEARYAEPRRWSTVWIAGSALGSQWSAARGGIGDLDVLVGVDIPTFLELNPQYQGFPESVVAAHFNREFRRHLMPHTTNWHGFETTFYVNPRATDIHDINPYAAYDLTHDTWTVHPPHLPEHWDPEQEFPQEWWSHLQHETADARQLVERFARLRADVAAQPAGSPQSINAVQQLQRTMDQAADLYDDIHEGRKQAFSPMGAGYYDYYNVRWQAHKRAGTEQSLNAIKKIRDSAREAEEIARYGGPILGGTEALTKAAATIAGIEYYQ